MYDNNGIWQDENCEFILGKDENDKDIKVPAIRKETGIWISQNGIDLLVEPSALYEESRKPDIIRVRADKIANIKQKCYDVITAGYYSTAKGGEPKLYGCSLTHQQEMKEVYDTMKQNPGYKPLWHDLSQTRHEVWERSEFEALWGDYQKWKLINRLVSDELETLVTTCDVVDIIEGYPDMCKLEELPAENQQHIMGLISQAMPQ